MFVYLKCNVDIMYEKDRTSPIVANVMGSLNCKLLDRCENINLSRTDYITICNS